MRNYDTTNGLPFPRVSSVHFTYPTEGNPLMTYNERNAIIDASGQVHFIDGGERQCTFEVDFSKALDPIHLIDPKTGTVIAGATTTIQELLLGLTALIRGDQAERDKIESLTRSEAVENV